MKYQRGIIKMETKYKIGNKVKVNSENDNENYDDFRNKVLVITDIATNIQEHKGFDEGVNQPLYSFKDEKGKDINCSLYEYEIE